MVNASEEDLRIRIEKILGCELEPHFRQFEMIDSTSKMTEANKFDLCKLKLI